MCAMPNLPSGMIAGVGLCREVGLEQGQFKQSSAAPTVYFSFSVLFSLSAAGCVS